MNYAVKLNRGQANTYKHRPPHYAYPTPTAWDSTEEGPMWMDHQRALKLFHSIRFDRNDHPGCVWWQEIVPQKNEARLV